MEAKDRLGWPEGLASGLEVLRHRRDEIKAVENGYTVPSGYKRHTVTADGHGGLSCGCGASCGPSEAHGVVCSHMWTARLYHAERVAAAEAGRG